ncbi:hypothetical protein B7P43_G01132, partial [Cryptotermes secundus]
GQGATDTCEKIQKASGNGSVTRAQVLPKNLNDGQKARRNEVSAKTLERLESEQTAHNMRRKFSPCDFHLFPKLKPSVMSYHFQTLDGLQKAVTDAIKTLREADFQSCYEAWKFRWGKCVASEVSYFEGNDADLDE